MPSLGKARVIMIKAGITTKALIKMMMRIRIGMRERLGLAAAGKDFNSEEWKFFMVVSRDADPRPKTYEKRETTDYTDNTDFFVFPSCPFV